MNDALTNAVLAGLADSQYPANNFLGPRLLTNSQQETIWQELKRQLADCRGFAWTVAFISADMLAPFKLIMEDLAQAGVSGTLVTGTYLNFNTPRVFRELLKIENLTVKVTPGPLHAKGYLFDHDGFQTAVIGSANFTRSALLANQEWCLRISSKDQAGLTSRLKAEFNRLARDGQPLTEAWIKNYELGWQPGQQRMLHVKHASSSIKPNHMQAEALAALDQLVKSGQHRALVVSATGTGKTYLAAFAVQAYQPRRFLYLVHREQIAKKALASFKQIIGGPASDYALLSGGQRADPAAKYLFATVQSAARDRFLQAMTKDAFDYILIDEAHRAAAPSYQRLMDHFQPDFWLGLTATPERMDQQDIYQLFDYNLAYEVRLRDALAEKMLTPFHYIGIRDYEKDGITSTDASSLRWLGASERVDYILKELDYYGYDGDQPRGLVFASRQEEARALAQSFSQQGHPARALTNQDSQAARQDAVQALEQGQLEYLVTVDLFNEGIDIPSLNQIVMLRSTQSSTVFIQQLGRGLRLFPGQTFVTVIDFIGNYQHNYLIPLALAGQKISKDQLRQQLSRPDFAGLSTVSFSRIASEEILRSLDKIKLDALKELKEAYQERQQELGRVPLLMDFARGGKVSPLLFIENKSLKHYGAFLEKMGEACPMSSYESQVLSFITRELATGKRPHELDLLKELFALAARGKEARVAGKALQKRWQALGFYDSSDLRKSLASVLSLDFFNVKSGKTTVKDQYGGEPIVDFENNADYCLNPKLLDPSPAFRRLAADAIATGLFLAKNYDASRQFTLYRQYDRKDVCRLLNWPLDVSRPMYGYRITNQVCPIFITYKKEEISEGNKKRRRSAVYDNQLSDGQTLRWYTRSPRHLDSAEVQELLSGVAIGQQATRVLVFVKRSDAYGKQFYYLGEAAIVPGSAKEELLGTKKPAVGLDLKLRQPLTPRMYDLLFAD